MKFIYRENFDDMPFVQKSALSALEINKHPKEIHVRMIELYWDYYNKLGDEIFLEFAYTHLGSFLRSGYVYKEFESLFSEVAKSVGYKSLQEYLHTINYKVKKVKLTKNRVQNILGNGFMYRDITKISKKEIVEEIMRKVIANETGTYRYVQHYKDKISLSYLIINQNGAHLLDNQGTEYTLLL